MSDKVLKPTTINKDIVKVVRQEGAHLISINHLKASRNIKRRREVILEQYDLRSPAWYVLGVVSQTASGVTAKELAQLLEVKSTYVTAIVGTLKKRKLIYTQTNPADSRSRLIFLSDEGQEFVTKVEKDLTDAIAKFLQGFSSTEVKHYLKILHMIADQAVPAST